ncbi:unnamed protein product [Symbiodinium sp. CCMP2456]|nr:unnamed protein product [Symbiodinium sp. CCMP2456]
MNFCTWIFAWSVAAATGEKPAPVDKLDVPAFLGRWYQTYGSFSVKYATELGADCVYVDYGALSNSSAISLVNSVQVFGHRVSVEGFAVPSPDRVGIFDVSLGPPGLAPKAPEPFRKSNYIVLMLGPRVGGKYDYAVVTDPTFLSLYVLVRDVSRFGRLHEAGVLDKVSQMGFTSFLNRPRRTNQHGCKYSDKDGTAVVV